MPVSDKQAALANLKESKYSFVVANGSIRVGKTLFGAIGFGRLIDDQQRHRKKPNGNRYAVVGHANVKATYDNVVVHILDTLHLLGYRSKKQGNSWDFIVEGNGCKFYIQTFAITNTHSFVKLQGGTFRSIFVDEAPLMDLISLEKIHGRVLTFDDWKIVHTGNPEGTEAHPYWQEFLSGRREDILYVHFEMKDNPIQTPEKIKKYERMFTRQMYERSVLGKWVAASGACYPNHLKLVNPPDKFDIIYGGLDYGEKDATTLVIVGLIDGRYVILDQFYHKNGDEEQLTLLDYRDRLVDFGKKMQKEYGKMIYLDMESSPQTLYSTFAKDAELQQYYIMRKVEKRKQFSKSKNSVQERVDLVNVMLKLDALVLAKEDLPIEAAIKNAIYDNNGDRLDNGTSDIDSLDALEYAIMRDFKKILKRAGYINGD